MVDDFSQSKDEPENPKPGPLAEFRRSEVITLALFGQWVQFPSERAFYRYASDHLREAFPRLPDRSQFNRLQRMQEMYSPLRIRKSEGETDGNGKGYRDE